MTKNKEIEVKVLLPIYSKVKGIFWRDLRNSILDFMDAKSEATIDDNPQRFEFQMK